MPPLLQSALPSRRRAELFQQCSGVDLQRPAQGAHLLAELADNSRECLFGIHDRRDQRPLRLLYLPFQGRQALADAEAPGVELRCGGASFSSVGVRRYADHLCRCHRWKNWRLGPGSTELRYHVKRLLWQYRDTLEPTCDGCMWR